MIWGRKKASEAGALWMREKQSEKHLEGSAALGLSPKDDGGKGGLWRSLKMAMTCSHLPVESITLASSEERTAGVWEKQEGDPGEGNFPSVIQTRAGGGLDEHMAVELKRTGRIQEPLGGHVSRT